MPVGINRYLVGQSRPDTEDLFRCMIGALTRAGTATSKRTFVGLESPSQEIRRWVVPCISSGLNDLASALAESFVAGQQLADHTFLVRYPIL